MDQAFLETPVHLVADAVDEDIDDVAVQIEVVIVEVFGKGPSG